MFSVLETVCFALFVLLMLVPGLFGIHMYALIFLAHWQRRPVRERQQRTIADYRRDRADEHWPLITTQIPLYNELAVAQRIIDAVAAIDYPAGRHHIQVLDDSNDDTRYIVDRAVARWQQRGCDIEVIRRDSREHYKAGALAHGLKSAKGEFVAIFDADFVPAPTFLQRLVPLIATQPQVGCVQGRWGHLNAEENWITDALTVGMDGHFGVEQPARGWNGFLLNFNGTAGIWRRAAIDDPRVGGWSGDTITEDLDLSYRAQIAGWKIEYCLDEVAPAELPADAAALKAQQRRWATGSVQTARKLLPAVWRSRLTLLQKLEATLHLTGYSVNVFMLLMALGGRTFLAYAPSDSFQHWLAWSWIFILVATAAPSLAYVYARWSVGGGFVGLGRILKLIVLGLGLSVNNTAAVLCGMVQRGGEFVRTPKTGNVGSSPVRRAPPGGSSHTPLHTRLWVAELALGGVCLFQWAYFLPYDRYVGGTFLLLYAIGLWMVGWQSDPSRALPRRPAALQSVLLPETDLARGPAA